MKHYFKYNNGYINIDEENLYLTNSGNWQETKELIEKGKISQQHNLKRISEKQNYWFTFYLAFMSFFVFSTETKVWLPIAIITGLLLFMLFNYFKRDFGFQYKIPLAKIDGIVPYESNGIKISFRNAGNEADFEIINGIEEKGITFLMKLKIFEQN
ncbi:hypothetical protein E0W68_11140 [Flavobacterium salilacus subsp. salilacus]|uniref:hypothetical protein n=1 Tax=Flavobacterium TaxID=237 RepID=UPI0010756820|nr:MULTISPECIES: hypothetical protein [Flavobacterium]KAF2517516.1 hypothetical protein E0W68_11140 [Flavobacterium salilacus subsp. salilacus]MBE1615664.1 hypothetical protein [Flavobacterium sp. SaA2.13]